MDLQPKQSNSRMEGDLEYQRMNFKGLKNLYIRQKLSVYLYE